MTNARTVPYGEAYGEVPRTLSHSLQCRGHVLLPRRWLRRGQPLWLREIITAASFGDFTKERTSPLLCPQGLESKSQHKNYLNSAILGQTSRRIPNDISASETSRSCSKS
jgi:hypothetical protein